MVPNQIQRDDAKRRITMAFNVRGRDVECCSRDLGKPVDRQLKFAPGYATYWRAARWSTCARPHGS
jgi:cobalt-zinc-cadmium resistance protein CzcA